MLALLTAAVLGGCSIRPLPPPDPGVSGPVLPDTVPVPDLEELPPPRPAVAVVLSADTSHYRTVADALGDGKWQRFVLDGDNGADVLAAVKAQRLVEAIAIGQQALELLAPTDLTVAYCQVFDADVKGGVVRGVAPLPDFGAQLDAWRARDSTLRGVGLITGPGHAELAARVAAAAESRAMTLHHAEVGSDRELLYVFRRMVPEIDGFLLYPDTRVLSPGAIREMLAYARKHHVSVLTYNRVVFDLGAALLVSADPGEVARQVVAALRADAGAHREVPLTRVVVETAASGRGSGR